MQGSASVEFAIIFPLFVLLLIGMLEFGLAIWRQAILTNASREGARAGIVSRIPRPTDADITTVVQTYLTGSGLDPTATTISITGTDGSFGDPLTVEVQYPNRFFVLPNLLPGLDASFTLQAKTVMLLE